MTQLFVGILIGFFAGVGVSVVAMAFGRRPTAREPVRQVAPEPPAGTPLLDAMLGGGEAKSDDGAERLRQNLRVKCLYDEVKVKRAIDFERSRDPNASEVDLIKWAIERWERENR